MANNQFVVLRVKTWIHIINTIDIVYVTLIRTLNITEIGRIHL